MTASVRPFKVIILFFLCLASITAWGQVDINNLQPIPSIGTNGNNPMGMPPSMLPDSTNTADTNAESPTVCFRPRCSCSIWCPLR